MSSSWAIPPPSTNPLDHHQYQESQIDSSKFKNTRKRHWSSSSIITAANTKPHLTKDGQYLRYLGDVRGNASSGSVQPQFHLHLTSSNCCPIDPDVMCPNAQCVAHFPAHSTSSNCHPPCLHFILCAHAALEKSAGELRLIGALTKAWLMS